MDRNEQLISELGKKGWTKAEAAKVRAILQQAPKKKTDAVKFLDSILYWVLLLVTIVANFIVSIVLVPFLLVFTGVWVYLALAFAGLVFGTLMDVVIRAQETLHDRHYVVAELFIPILALLNIYIMTRLSNQLAVIMELPGHTSPLIASIVYVVAFSLPHVIYKYAHKAKVSAPVAA